MSSRIKATVIQNPNHVVNGVSIKATVENQKIVPGPVSAGILGNRTSTTNIALTRTAMTVITKYQVVEEAGDTGIKNPGQITDASAILGIAANFGSVGQTLDVIVVGEIHDPSWQWSQGSIYVGPGGTLTQVNYTGSLRRVAVAISPHTIFVDMREGARGQNTILSGGGSPTSLLGSQGDFYIDLLTYELWGPKTSEWDMSRSLVGPQGPAVQLTSMIYDFPSSTNWHVVHNLGRYPAVVCQDSSGEEVVPDVHYVDINTIDINMTYPIGGRVILT